MFLKYHVPEGSQSKVHEVVNAVVPRMCLAQMARVSNMNTEFRQDKMLQAGCKFVDRRTDIREYVIGHSRSWGSIN